MNINEIETQTIAEFMKCRDDFDYFKEKHATHKSYVAALFAFDLIFRRDIVNMIMISPKFRLIELRSEIMSIIEEFDKNLPGLTTLKRINVHTLGSYLNSHLYLRSHNLNGARGMTLNKVYYDGPENFLEFCPWMRPTDIPNVFETTLGK